MIAHYLPDSVRAKEFSVLFGIFTEHVNLLRLGLLQGLDRISGSWLLSVLVRFGSMLEMIWFGQCTEVV